MSDSMHRRASDREGDAPNPVRASAQSGTGELLTGVPALELQMAKAQLGGAIKSALVRTDSPMKEFGTPAVVERMCRGELSDVLGRVWARPDTREEFVLALVKASGLYVVEPQIRRRV